MNDKFVNQVRALVMACADYSCKRPKYQPLIAQIASPTIYQRLSTAASDTQIDLGGTERQISQPISNTPTPIPPPDSTAHNPSKTKTTKRTHTVETRSEANLSLGMQTTCGRYSLVQNPPASPIQPSIFSRSSKHPPCTLVDASQ